MKEQIVLIVYNDIKKCCLYCINRPYAHFLSKKGIIYHSSYINHPRMNSRREALGVLKSQYDVKLIKTREGDRFKEEYYDCSSKN